MVLCYGSCLIHTEYGDRSQRLYRRQTAHQGMLPGKPPGTHGEEYCEHYREFLRYHGHRQGDARQNTFDQPLLKRITGEVAVGKCADKKKQERSDAGTDRNQTLRLFLKRSQHLFGLKDTASRLSIFGGCACLFHQNQCIALYNQCACIAEVLLPVPLSLFLRPGRNGIGRPGVFPDPDGFAGQRRLIHTKIAAG